MGFKLLSSTLTTKTHTKYDNTVLPILKTSHFLHLVTVLVYAILLAHILAIPHA